LLDLGTGGGEWLAALEHRPGLTVATEAWGPNVPVARARLEPLGIQVVQVEPARDNVEQREDEPSGTLPFADMSFDLVVSRHEAFVAREVARVLVPQGRLLTQQLSTGDAGFAELLGVQAPAAETLTLDFLASQVEAAGLRVRASDQGERITSFHDVGALAWYLKAVPWTVPGFTIEAFRQPLRRLHESEWPLEVRLYSFWLAAEKELG
jgi:SAM-dependent methyltransferase